MKFAAAVAGLLAAFVILTWVLLRGIDSGAPAYSTVLRAFDDFALAEASLQRDVLLARAGLLRDYDPLANSIEMMESATAQLRFYAQAKGISTVPLDRLAVAVAQEEALTERFKSQNAVLQNSLAYAGHLSGNPDSGAQIGEAVPETSALAAAILRLTRDPSPESVQALRQRIDQFSARLASAGLAPNAAEALVSHARLLTQLLPAADETLKSLIAVPALRALGETHAQFSQSQSAAQASAQRSRLFLYISSLLLALMLVRLGLQLRARAQERERRAALDHIIAENSTRLINIPASETEPRLREVLAGLSNAIGTERAYVVLDGNPPRVIAHGLEYPQGWPVRALELYERLSGAEPQILRFRDVAKLPRGYAKDSLLAEGLRAWACVPLFLPGRTRAIMGFDALQPVADRIFPLSTMRLAGDAVANAMARQHLERDRAALSARLERARRMQTVGTFVSGIAHNFNNITGAILGYTEMLGRQIAAETLAAKNVEEILRAAERARDLVDKILSFGRRPDAYMQPVHLGSLLKETASLLRVSLPSGVEIVTAMAGPEITISGEPAQLQQVILNLCNNAVQAMDGHGVIQVTAGERKVNSVISLSHGQLVPGTYVCLSVSDTGRGFDEMVARRLFEPFFTTRSKGTGLGLATVRAIVQDHSGNINVESEPGHGSRFEIWIPAAQSGHHSTVQSPYLLGQGETVMVVEGHRERLLRDEEMLAALGYEPVGFDRLDDALAALRAKADRFDVILVSHTGQELSGLDFARKLHEVAPAHPLLLAAPSSSDMSSRSLAEAGISEVLHRPLVSAELAAALACSLHASASQV